MHWRERQGGGGKEADRDTDKNRESVGSDSQRERGCSEKRQGDGGKEANRDTDKNRESGGSDRQSEREREREREKGGDLQTEWMGLREGET